MNPLKFYIALVLCLAGIPVSAKRIIVNPGGPVKSVNLAISLAAAGDTILVKSGIYREGNITINKPLVFIGEGRPVLDGEMKHEVFTINADGVSISGFRIINSGVSSVKDLAGIGAINTDRLVIRNNEFAETFFGIHISNSRNSIIENNRLLVSARSEYEIGNGIHLWQSTQATIRNNYVSGHRDGIYFEFVTSSRIEGNTCERNQRYGLHFMFSHDDEYHRNSFRENGAGVAVMYTRNVTMTYNLFEKNWGNSVYGLLLKDISDSKVTNNRFVQNTIAVYMEGTSRTEFSENIFTSNGWGIRLQASCDANTFTRNNFTRNTFDFATNGTLVLNTINGNYWDKYQGYDLNKDGIGDVPYRPVNMYTMVVERIPTAVLLWRSFLVFLLDRAEKVFPAVTPENLKDEYPNLRPHDFNT
ncbi:MAG: nitrous oxide reductase family maturation protein NosD [Flammeovirgaceae bacterium]|nr:MAG: nitrous oxide reductase family maturation protein NosD [Flammeovirgaceae bacterium]